MHEHVGHDHFISKLGVFSLVVRINMVADVKPGPAIKSARLYAADVIGRQVVAEFVPLVCAHPEFVAARTKRDPDSVSNSPSINFLSAAIGIEFEDARAICFRRIVGIVRARAD